MAGSTSSYYENPFTNVEPLTPVQEEALKGKLGTELSQIDSTVSDTGQQNTLTTPSQVNTTTPSSSTSVPSSSSNSNISSGYYVYDQKNSDPSYAVPGTKNLFGANLDVVSKLDNIVFEPFADGSLRNSIAYIVPWTRGSSSSGTQLSSAPAAAPREATLDTLIGDLTSVPFNSEGVFEYVPDLESTFKSNPYIPIWDSSDAAWNLADSSNYFTNDLVDFNIVPDFKLNLNSNYYSQYSTDDSGQSSVERSEAESRQTNLSSEIPIGFRQGLLTGASFLADNFIQDATLSNIANQTITAASNIFNAPSGPIYLGNANGIINQVLDYANLFGANIPTGFTTNIHPDLQSNKSKWNDANLSGASGTPEGMWQFMFNPGELSLSVGPQFASSETWGVSDEPNAGQPLHWTNHKNAELRFSKVLLNGYIFKKSVESLEQGIIELFMKTPTNDATHGPRVLEFVWGKRCFGPCVIKDIQITEKMWDNGLLVNAEVSFTLVRVPEWTINDGQVSAYDPSSLLPANDPNTARNRKTESPNDSDAPQDPNAYDPSKVVENWPKAKCTNVKRVLDNRDSVIDRVIDIRGIMNDFAKGIRIFTSFGPRQQMEQVNRITSYYYSWLDVVQSSDTTFSYNYGKCGREAIGQGQTELSLKLESLPNIEDTGRAGYTPSRRAAVDSYTQKIMNCANEIGKSLEAKFNSNQCPATLRSIGGGNAGGAQSIDPNASAYIPSGT